MQKFTLKGRRIINGDGVAVAEIIGERHRDSQGRPWGGYGYRLMSDYHNPTTRDWPYFRDAARAALAKAGGAA